MTTALLPTAGSATRAELAEALDGLAAARHVDADLLLGLARALQRSPGEAAAAPPVVTRRTG